jgi:hypothetical protein
MTEAERQQRIEQQKRAVLAAGNGPKGAAGNDKNS